MRFLRLHLVIPDLIGNLLYLCGFIYRLRFRFGLLFVISTKRSAWRNLLRNRFLLLISDVIFLVIPGLLFVIPGLLFVIPGLTRNLLDQLRQPRNCRRHLFGRLDVRLEGEGSEAQAFGIDVQVVLRERGARPRPSG